MRRRPFELVKIWEGMVPELEILRHCRVSGKYFGKKGVSRRLRAKIFEEIKEFWLGRGTGIENRVDLERRKQEGGVTPIYSRLLSWSTIHDSKGQYIDRFSRSSPLGRFATLAGKGLKNLEEFHMMHIPSHLRASARTVPGVADLKKTFACSPESTELKRRTNILVNSTRSSNEFTWTVVILPKFREFRRSIALSQLEFSWLIS